MMKFLGLIMISLFVLPAIFCKAYILLKYVCNHKQLFNQKIDDIVQQKKMQLQLKLIISNIGQGILMCYCNFIGGLPSHILRNFYYKYIFGMKVHRRAVIYGRGEFRAPYNIIIGEGTIVGDCARIDGRNGVVIGKNVNLSSEVCIWTEQHDTNDSLFRCLYSENNDKKVVIGDRVWLSCRCIILPGVKIGEGSIVAAGAVVTKDVLPYSIYAGIPARKIGERNKDLQYNFEGTHLWFY